MSKSTAYEYFRRLSSFEAFVSSEYNTTVDDIIEKIKAGFHDPYSVLSNYSVFMQNNINISVITLKLSVVTAKNLLEYCDTDISPRKFVLKVKLPKSVRRNKEALSKEDIIDILNACSNIKLKTYVMFLACTGSRAVEGLSIRYIDLDETSNPAKVRIRGEYTKTKVDRIVLLTSEMTNQIKLWLEYKHRTRRVSYRDVLTGETTTEYRNVDDQDPGNLYSEIRPALAKTLDRIGKGSFEDNKRRRNITLHSFRRFVKSTISDLWPCEKGPRYSE
ncbi:MAG TPA: tyrosine-type recombinase/integrase [Nitrososphaeraceae archaeon]|nr:tyrosine-type recombinase/integrase [Nitrososphaeraceae archaeon]